MTLFSRGLAALALLAAVAGAQAVPPSLFKEYPSETLSIEVTIPVPERPQQVTLKPLLLKPASAPPWSVVVLPSNCGGLDDRMWHFWAPAFTRQGIAVLLVDSFNPRGFASLCHNQFQLTVGARLQDVHQVLDHLRRDPRVRPDRIALGGHSVGGTTAYQSAFAGVLPMLGRPPGSGYNAFIAAAPSCNLIYKSRELLGPTLLIGGDKDDWTPVAPCLSELEKARAQGQPVQTLIFPGAHHTFSTSGVVYSSRVMKAPPDAPQAYVRQLSYLPRQTRVELPSGEEFSLDDLIRRYAGFMGAKIFGAHVGGDWDKAPEAADASARFLKELGW